MARIFVRWSVCVTLCCCCCCACALSYIWPAYRQCLESVELKFYGARSRIPASLFDVDRYMKKNLWLFINAVVLWCCRSPYTYMNVLTQHIQVQGNWDALFIWGRSVHLEMQKLLAILGVIKLYARISIFLFYP